MLNYGLKIDDGACIRGLGLMPTVPFLMFANKNKKLSVLQYKYYYSNFFEVIG